jgi:2-dehydro-3-deoxygalactonokinase
MAGMVGSNVGWKVAPYLPVPAHFSAIGEQLTSVGDNIWIIPGLCVSRDDNHNVMRGEETQLLGARTLSPSSVYVMPGTHCKWVQADAKQIHDFRTVMTGELHHLLLRHSLVGAGLPEQVPLLTRLTAGLERGLHSPDVLPQLFEVRASHVLGAAARAGQRVSVRPADWRGSRQHARTLRDEQVTIVAGDRWRTAISRPERHWPSDHRGVGRHAFQTGIRSIAHAVAN